MQCCGNRLDPPSSSIMAGVWGMLRWYLTHDPSSTMGSSSPSPLNSQPETERQRLPTQQVWAAPCSYSSLAKRSRRTARWANVPFHQGVTVRWVHCTARSIHSVSGGLAPANGQEHHPDVDQSNHQHHAAHGIKRNRGGNSCLNPTSSPG